MQRSALFPSCFIAISLVCLVVYASTLWAATPSGQDQTTIFGGDPVFSPGIKPRVVVDAFGVIDETITQQQRDLIEKSIQEWLDAGIEYAAYYSFRSIETDLQYDQARMAAMARTDLDGNPATQAGPDGRTAYVPSITRQAYRQYLIDAGKLAIDLGARHIVFDDAALDLATLSFDDEIVSAFEQSESVTGFVAAVRNVIGQADFAGIDLNAYVDGNGPPTYLDALRSQAHWDQWTAFVKKQGRQYINEIFDALHAYAASRDPAQTVQLAANRYADTVEQWEIIDRLDYMLAETFLDQRGYPEHDLNYLYKAAAAGGRNFWSWNFPNNTDALNGGQNQPPNMLDRLFVAQTFANGGLSQVAGGDWPHYLGNNGARPRLTVPDYQLVERHPELFNHTPSGRIAVVLGVAAMAWDPGGVGPTARGITYLLSATHQLWEMLPAYTPPGGSELLTAAKLARFDTVILPKTRLLSDAAITALETFLNADPGHTVIGIGAVGSLDEAAQDKSGSRTFDDLFATNAADTTTYAGTVVGLADDRDYGFQFFYANDQTARDNAAAAFLADPLVSPRLPAQITTDLPPTVQITRFETADGSHIYHLVNRDVTGGQPGSLAAVPAGKTLTVPVPAAFPNPAVSILTPENPAPQAATVNVAGNSAAITLPELGLWTIVKVGSEAADGALPDHRPWSAFNFVYRPNGSETLFYNHHRPDERDADGKLLFPYWYWRGGGDRPLPIEIPFFATDDHGVATVDLYYRHSPDGTTWGAWQKLATKTFDRPETLDFTAPGPDDYFTISAAPPEGDGHYQFYTQATDNAGQTEIVVPGPETGYGIDTHGPPKVREFHETNGAENGVWTTVTHPVFAWTNGQDLSGVAETSLQLTDTANGATVAFCTFQEIGPAVTIDPAACSTAMPTPLADGIYRVTLQHKDGATNASPAYQVFELRIGNAPTQAPTDPTATAGDGRVTITWELPADTTGYDFTQVYVAPTDEPDILAYARNNNLTARLDTTQTEATISGLTNGVSYRFALEGQQGIAPGDLVTPACTFTPDAVNPQSDCPASGGGTCPNGICDAGEDATSCPQDCPAATFAVSGAVTGPDGAPAYPNVAIELTDATGATLTANTGQDGAYSFPSVAPGTYTITPQVDTGKFTVTPTSATVTVTDQPLAQDFVLQPVAQDQTTLFGTVTSSFLGYPAGVKGAHVVVNGPAGPFETTTQDQTGDWRIESIPNGTYSITISAPYHQDLVLENQDLTGGERRIDLPAGGLQPLPLQSPSWDSNANGTLDLGDVLFWLQGLSGWMPATTPAPGGTNTIKGTVTSSALGYEAGIKDAEITIRSDTGLIQLATTTADQSGTWQVNGLADGSYTVNITATGHQPYHVADLQVQGGEVAVELPAGGLTPATAGSHPWDANSNHRLDLEDIVQALRRLAHL